MIEALRDAWRKECDHERRRAEYVPAPEEIARQAAAIRAEWSDEERQERATWSRTPWAVPTGSYNEGDS